MTLPSPSACPWVRQCLIDFGSGLTPGYVERGVYGDQAHPADGTVYLAKYDPPVDPWQPIEDAGYAVSTSQPWQPSDPLPPVYPCRCVDPDPLPSIADVPVPASAGLLIAAVAVLAMLRRRK